MSPLGSNVSLSDYNLCFLMQNVIYCPMYYLSSELEKESPPFSGEKKRGDEAGIQKGQVQPWSSNNLWRSCSVSSTESKGCNLLSFSRKLCLTCSMDDRARNQRIHQNHKAEESQVWPHPPKPLCSHFETCTAWVIMPFLLPTISKFTSQAVKIELMNLKQCSSQSTMEHRQSWSP